MDHGIYIVWQSILPRSAGRSLNVSSLVAGAFQLAIGQLADLLGRKAMFLAGMGSFSVFVLILAFAQNPFWMVILCGVSLPVQLVTARAYADIRVSRFWEYHPPWSFRLRLA